MKLTSEQYQAEAALKVRRALALIERAQNDLASACAELSALEGGISVWKSTGSMHERIKALWYRVEKFRRAGRYKLDSTHRDAMEQRSAARSGA